MKNTIKKFMEMLSALFTTRVEEMEKKNPELILIAEKEKRVNMIREFNKGLQGSVSYCQGLIEEIQKNEHQIDSLSLKIKAHLENGNNEIAEQYALELKGLEERNVACENRLIESKQSFDQMILVRDKLVKESDMAIKEIQHQISEAMMIEAQADLIEMSKGVIGEENGSGENMLRLEEMVKEKRISAKSRLVVANLSSDPKMDEIEEKIMAKQALEEFKSKNNLCLNGTNKEMKSLSEYNTQLIQ